MCCLVTILLLAGPRVALVVWGLMDSAYFALAFHPRSFPLPIAWPFWVWPLLGAIFLPWTTLAYLVVFPGGLAGASWLLIGLGLLIDLGAHIGGGYRNRDRFPGHRRE